MTRPNQRLIGKGTDRTPWRQPFRTEVFRSSGNDGRCAGRVGVSKVGRCVAGLEWYGIVGTDKVGRCSAK